MDFIPRYLLLLTLLNGRGSLAADILGCKNVSGVRLGDSNWQPVLNNLDDRSPLRSRSDLLSLQSKAIWFLAEVITYIGWKYTSILFDSCFEGEASMLTDLLSNSGVKVIQHHIRDNHSNAGFLESSYHRISHGWRQYVIVARRSSVETLFRELNIFDGPGLSPTAIKTFSMSIVWGTDVTSRFLEDKVGIISNVAVLEGPECRTNSESMLKLKTNGQVQESTFGLSTAMWQPSGREFQAVFFGKKPSLLISVDTLFPNINYGLNNMHLRVTTNPWPMYVIKSKDATGNVVYQGLCLDLLKELSLKLNFSYTLQEPEDQEWGRVVDGKWTGLMGDIVFKKADLVAAPLSAQEERVPFVDFTAPFYTDYNEIMMRMSDKEKTRWMILLRPFEWRILLVVACVLPAVTLLLWVCEKFSPYYNTNPRRKLYRGNHHLRDCVWYMYGSLLSRSGMYLPRALSGRCIVVFWWFFIVLLAATYCGNLMALLAVTRDKKPFNSIAEMVAQTDYVWGANNGTYFLELLKTSPDKEYMKVWEGLKKFSEQDPSILHPDLETQIKRTEKGNFAFITDSTAVAMTLPGRCDLVKADEQFMMLQYGMALQKDSAYTVMLSERIIANTENGLMDMWAQKWSPKTVPCPAFLQTGARQIMLIDIQSAFYLLSAGIVLAALSLCVEFFYTLPKKIIRKQE